MGRVSAAIDPSGHKKLQEFDLLDRVTKVTDPNTGVTTFAYDAASNPVASTDAAWGVGVDGSGNVYATGRFTSSASVSLNGGAPTLPLTAVGTGEDGG